MRTRYDGQKNYSFGYLDESSTDRKNYFGCGLILHGPCVSGIDDWNLNERYRNRQTEMGFQKRSNIAWKKVPSKDGNYLKYYTEFIESFFENDKLSFHSLIVDTSKYKINSKKYFKRSKDRGIDAFSFHLINSRALKFPTGTNKFYFRFDRRNRPPGQTLNTIRRRLESAVRKSGYYSTEMPSIKLRSIAGGNHPLIHLCDLLLGAVCAEFNGNISSVGKIFLKEVIEKKIGRKLCEPTGPQEKKFNIWYFNPD